jgi:hypothetical protein
LENLQFLEIGSNIFRKLISLSLNENCTLKYIPGTIFPDQLTSTLRGNVSKELVTYLLVSSGYLTQCEEVDKFKIPNKEVADYFKIKVF